MHSSWTTAEVALPPSGARAVAIVLCRQHGSEHVEPDVWCATIYVVKNFAPSRIGAGRNASWLSPCSYRVAVAAAPNRHGATSCVTRATVAAHVWLHRREKCEGTLHSSRCRILRVTHGVYIVSRCSSHRMQTYKTQCTMGGYTQFWSRARSGLPRMGVSSGADTIAQDRGTTPTHPPVSATSYSTASCAQTRVMELCRTPRSPAPARWSGAY